MVKNSEFDIIQRYFASHAKGVVRQDVILPIGDDCAITAPPMNHYLATTTDTLTVGTHFQENILPEDLAYKALMVNLSDLAASGAKPAWVSLAISLPKIDNHWLNAFSASFFQLLSAYNIALIGGDTTQGALAITITAQGFVAKNKYISRHTAKANDWIYVSGTIGDSAGGLALLLGKTQPVIPSMNQGINEKNQDVTTSKKFLLERHFRPTARVELGTALGGLASSCIDISDGLIGDLTHILKQSGCDASIELDQLPISPQLITVFGQQQAEKFALSGGEDYELCFTIAESQRDSIEKVLSLINVPCQCIGQLTGGTGKTRFMRAGKEIALTPLASYDHFS